MYQWVEPNQHRVSDLKFLVVVSTLLCECTNKIELKKKSTKIN